MSEIEVLKEKVKNFKLLLVDDDKEILNGTQALLKKFFKNVVVCDDAQEALELFSNEKDFDVVITDILMPKMDGLEMLKKINEIQPDTFSIFISASRSMLEKGEGLSNISLTKPISFDDLVMVIKKISEHK